ncbi:MAG: NAD(P)H-binding protein [Mycobacterium sp.]|nr:NAD(P)H-binding protein [Mycobacterium sp.]
MVVGATGLLGRPVVDGLIRAGCRVRAVSRHSGSWPPGVTPCPADVRDAEAFRSVLPGADGIFLNLPPTLQEQDLARIGADITQAGIPITALLSSDLVGSCPDSVMAASHQREETVLGAALGDSLAVLRPGMFMSNDAAEWSASIRDDGKVITSFPDALEVPIAPVDIAAAAVAALTAHGNGPHPTRRLLGPEWLSARDRVTVLAKALNRPITVVEVSAEEHVALLAQRLPAPIARQKVTMRAGAPRSIADCPDLPLGKDRTSYAAWAAANIAAFGVEVR